MKLFLILYTMHGIAGVSQVQDDPKQCLIGAAVWNTQAAEVAATGIGVNGNVLSEADQAEVKGWRMACEYHALRPQLSEGVK